MFWNQQIAVQSFIHVFKKNKKCVWDIQEVGIKPSLMIWNLHAAAAKPFGHFSYEYTWFSNLQEIALKPLDNLESPGELPRRHLQNFQMKYLYIQLCLDIFRNWLARLFANLCHFIQPCAAELQLTVNPIENVWNFDTSIWRINSISQLRDCFMLT